MTTFWNRRAKCCDSPPKMEQGASVKGNLSNERTGCGLTGSCSDHSQDRCGFGFMHLFSWISAIWLCFASQGLRCALEWMFHTLGSWDPYSYCGLCISRLGFAHSVADVSSSYLFFLIHIILIFHDISRRHHGHCFHISWHILKKTRMMIHCLYISVIRLVNTKVQNWAANSCPCAHTTGKFFPCRHFLTSTSWKLPPSTGYIYSASMWCSWFLRKSNRFALSYHGITRYHLPGTCQQKQQFCLSFFLPKGGPKLLHLHYVNAKETTLDAWNKGLGPGLGLASRGL